MPNLFEPFTLKRVTLRNRIVAAPMCMYSASEGVVGELHRSHLEQLALGGSGLVTLEMTSVSPEGRITWGDTGLWNDAQLAALKPIAAAIKASGSVPGIQLGHAGRKASTNRPWEGDNQIADEAPNGWPIIGPSAVAFGSEKVWKMPQAMSVDDIARVTDDFAASARRARRAGFEWLELHFAHAFLAHSFLSPYSNHRTDRYGGSFENRSRFIRETFAVVRAAWPEEFPLSARLGVVEYDGRDEETIAESIELVRQLKDIGLDFVSVSVGFSRPDAPVPWNSPAFTRRRGCRSDGPFTPSADAGCWRVRVHGAGRTPEAGIGEASAWARPADDAPWQTMRAPGRGPHRPSRPPPMAVLPSAVVRIRSDLHGVVSNPRRLTTAVSPFTAKAVGRPSITVDPRGASASRRSSGSGKLP